MTLIIFVIILGLLVLVHELGHFLAAKKAGVYVEEFGFGYPPRAVSIGRRWGTLFSINWIPFGGFVKIFGENYEEEVESLELKAESKELKAFSKAPSSKLQALSFVQVSKKWQAVILVAGVLFNIIFAWLLFSLGFMIGLPTPIENNFGSEVKNPMLTIVQVIPDSPAKKAGLKTGDKIINVSLEDGRSVKSLVPEDVSEFINNSEGKISIQVNRGKENLNFILVPQTGLVENKKIIGINMDMIGLLSLPIHKAFLEGGRATLQITHLTIDGLVDLIKNAARGQADISEVTGPVGIVGLVGDASRLGFAYLITFTALISVNLAIINLVPFPALDGGRLLFVAVEGITGRSINPKFAQITNTVGFFLLIALMLFVTYRDILKLF